MTQQKLNMKLQKSDAIASSYQSQFGYDCMCAISGEPKVSFSRWQQSEQKMELSYLKIRERKK